MPVSNEASFVPLYHVMIWIWARHLYLKFFIPVDLSTGTGVKMVHCLIYNCLVVVNRNGAISVQRARKNDGQTASYSATYRTSPQLTKNDFRRAR